MFLAHVQRDIYSHEGIGHISQNTKVEFLCKIYIISFFPMAMKLVSQDVQMPSVLLLLMALVLNSW